MKIFYRATFLLIVFFVAAACSRKKNTFINRNMHALTTEYNILYNGENAYKDSKNQLAAGYVDNYWEILPIERIEVEESAESLREEKTGNFARAEEKAVKAIQKHSMYINGKEHNPQIDEAYLLLGKSRYYDGRFIPALDAFNFILDRYPESNSVNTAKVWKAKTNIRLNNEELAIENLKKMLGQKKISEEDWVDGAAMLAQAYVNLDSLPQALSYIKIAADNIKDKELKGRYTFIKGQIYNRLGEKDSANKAFDDVIALKRKTSRSYYIQSFLEKSRNFDYNKGDKAAQLELLEDLAKDRENRPYLDAIFYNTAEFYRNNKLPREAVTNYNKSIQNFKRDRILQSKNYMALAEISFDSSEYKRAGAYYDSTLTFIEDKSREWRRIKKKRENLDDVIKYEDIAATNDSIMKLVKMTDEERLAYFTEYTNKLREKAVQDSISRAKRETEIANQEFFDKGKSSPGGKAGGTFYFYNPSTVAYGKQEFRKRWGDRALEDNWRISTKAALFGDFDEAPDQENIPIADNELFKPETYIAKIPSDAKVIDSIHGERNFAYYQLGLIYKEKFREYNLAANRLETLLKNEPEERLIVPSQYHLIRIYETLGRDEKVDHFTKEILTNHPDTRYAEILRNPNSQLPTDESSPEFKYNELYRQFEDQKYAEVIDKAEDFIQLYEGTDIVPKFEMLKATAIGRQDGFVKYQEALNFVALNYPNSDEGKQSQKMINEFLPTIQSPAFSYDEKSENWKLVYQFKNSEIEEARKLKEKLDKGLEEMRYTHLTTSLDYFNPEYSFVIIHGGQSKEGSRRYGQLFKEKKGYNIKRPYFEITSKDYKTLQIHKNLDNYLNRTAPADPDFKP